MINLTPEEREIGSENYYEAVGYTRRDFLKGALCAGVGSSAALGAMYFGYDPSVGDPVRVGVIGTGDEGNILIGAINPDYVQVVAIADIRPSSIHRALHGDWGGSKPAYTHSLRPGLMQVYGWQTEDMARQQVQVYERYQELLENDDVEAVIIALPLHLHAPAAMAAMAAGKHVLTEKLMAHNIAQCKLMGRFANEQQLYLATGHQRHYNVLYDNAKHLLKWGLLGEVHHIRAQWHRGNLPGRDSWKPPLPGGELARLDDPKNRFKKGESFDEIAWTLNRFEQKLAKEQDPAKAELLRQQVAQWTAWVNDKDVPAETFGYQSLTLPDRERPPLEELIRWRLWDRTGGGLMAELGSHQLDAASIFVSALRDSEEKVHPLTVHAVGGRHIFPADRQAEDHVYCMYEFPGPGYDPKFDVGYKDPMEGVPGADGVPPYNQDDNKKIVVTYSSINGNGWGGYGELVLGTKGTLILEKEQEVMLFQNSSTSTKVGVKGDQDSAVLDTQASGNYAPLAQAAARSAPVSRGYREEIEHWAWCIRNASPENQPRCHPKLAMGDAVIALTTKVALDQAAAGKGGFIRFDEAWFEMDDDATPDGSSSTLR